MSKDDSNPKIDEFFTARLAFEMLWGVCFSGKYPLIVSSLVVWSSYFYRPEKGAAFFAAWMVAAPVLVIIVSGVSMQLTMLITVFGDLLAESINKNVLGGSLTPDNIPDRVIYFFLSCVTIIPVAAFLALALNNSCGGAYLICR